MNRYARTIVFLIPLLLYEDLILAAGLIVLSLIIADHERIMERINKLDLPEFIFFTYMFHMLIGERDFAYIGFEPLYITEITIFALSVLYLRKLVKIKKLLLPYYLLVCIGLIFALLYFPANKINALRDSLILVYAIWVPIIYYIFNDKKKYTLFFELLKLFIVIKVVNYLYLVALILLGIWYPSFEGFRFGVGYAIPSLIVVMLVLPLKEFDVKYKLLSLVMILAIFTLFHRSLFLGILLVFAVYFVLGSWKMQKTLLRYGTLGLIGLIGFVAIYVSIIDFDIWGYLADKTSLQEGNISYRFISWGKVLEKFQDNYLLGYGVGKPLFFVLNNVFYDTINVSYFQIRDLGGNAQPHNSYLNILARFGIFVAPIFLWSLFKPLTRIKTTRIIRNFSLPIYNRFLLLLGFMLIMFVFAFFNVVLESPHFSFPFWLSVAMVLGYKKQALNYKKILLVKDKR